MQHGTKFFINNFYSNEYFINFKLYNSYALIFSIIAILFVTPSKCHSAEYKVQAGDILNFSVTGLPELNQKIAIPINSGASFPLIGEIDVSGLTLKQIRSLVREKIPRKSFNIRSSNRGEITTVISAPEIIIDISDYRPVYIGGDVSNPGEQAYKPGLTVLKAITVAGGYNFSKYKSVNPSIDFADFKSEHESLLVEYMKLDCVRRRLEAELAGKSEFIQQNFIDKNRQNPMSMQVQEAEERILKSRMDSYFKEKSSLKKFIDNAVAQVGVLEEQSTREEEGVKIDQGEIDRINDLAKRGVVPITRVVETRRVALSSSTRSLLVNAQLAQVRKERDEAIKNLSSFENRRRGELYAELQDNLIRTMTLKSRQQATDDKLIYTGILKSQLVRGTGILPQILLFRTNQDGQREKISAEPDTPLSPGDALEVSLSTDNIGTKSQQ